jgi:hypothetical protein
LEEIFTEKDSSDLGNIFEDNKKEKKEERKTEEITDKTTTLSADEINVDDIDI